MKHTPLLIMSIFILTACNKQEGYVNHDQPNHNELPPSEYELKVSSSLELKDIEYQTELYDTSKSFDFRGYLKPTDTIASFIGDGNEFASYKEQTISLSNDYVATIIDNGANNTLKVYRIVNHRIEIIVNELIDDPDSFTYPELSYLSNLSPLEIYISGPIEIGTTFGTWKIVETNVSLQTPYQTFENVFIIEEDEDDMINRKYFAYNYGVIKTESILKTKTDEYFVITSTIEDIWN